MRYTHEETSAFFRSDDRHGYQKQAMVIDSDCEAGRMKLGMISGALCVILSEAKNLRLSDWAVPVISAGDVLLRST
jgi:hypothetical protein